MATTKVILSGPLFSGEASAAARELTDSLAREMAEIGQTWIRVEAMGMDKSGRGGTGRAAAGVHLDGGNGAYVISGGIRKGEYAWPWLEGDSKRNQSTGFKGYHTFRRTRLRLRRQAGPYIEAKLQEYLALMGGGSV
jgi:hypothetical protein